MFWRVHERGYRRTVGEAQWQLLRVLGPEWQMIDRAYARWCEFKQLVIRQWAVVISRDDYLLVRLTPYGLHARDTIYHRIARWEDMRIRLALEAEAERGEG